MVEMVDTRDLGSRAEMRWGSSPHTRTKQLHSVVHSMREWKSDVSNWQNILIVSMCWAVGHYVKRGSIHNSLDDITLPDAEFELGMRKVMIILLWIMMGRYNSGRWVQ